MDTNQPSPSAQQTEESILESNQEQTKPLIVIPNFFENKLFLLALVLVAVGGIIGLFFTFNDFQTSVKETQIAVTPTQQPVALSEWKVYKSDQFPFTFKYPPHLDLQTNFYENQETITLSALPTGEKVKTGNIYINLYAKGQVSFGQDPSFTAYYQQMYPKDFNETMSSFNGINARIFSGYVDTNKDRKMTEYETAAYLWNNQGEALVRLQAGEESMLSKEEIQQIINSIQFTGMFPRAQIEADPSEDLTSETNIPETTPDEIKREEEVSPTVVPATN